MNFDQHHVNCCYCPIYTEQEFAIDDECHICEQDAQHEYIEVYQSHIEFLDREIRKLQKSNGGCHCCEPVGELNLKLRKELDELKIKYLKLITR